MPSLPRALRGEVATIQRDFIYPAYDGSEAWPRDEVLREEGGYGWRRWDVYSRLLFDAHVGAVFSKRWGAVVGREWEVEPGDSSRKARKAAEMCEAQLKAMATRTPMFADKGELVVGPSSAFDEAVLGLQSSILYGLSICENMWGQDGSEVYIESLYPRDIRRFMMIAGPRGYRLRLRSMDSPSVGLSLNPEKFTVARYSIVPTEDPWGLGKGSQLFYPTWAKKNAAAFWMIFADKMGNPTSVAQVPKNTSKEKRGEILAMLGAIASDAGVVIDNDVALEFIEASARGSNSTHAALIDWCNQEISKAVLGETGTTDQSGGGGSRARDEVANEQRIETAKQDADLLGNLLSRTLLKHITRFNFGPDVASPRIWWQFPELEERMDRQKEAAVVVSLAGAGFVPTREWVEEKFEIELAEEEEITSPLEGLFGGVDGGGGDGDGGGGDPPQDNEPQDLDSLGFSEGKHHDPVAAMTTTTMAPLLDKVRDRLTTAESLQQVRAELPDMLSQVGGDFAETLAQGIAAAELRGRWEVVEEAEVLEPDVINAAEGEAT